MRSVLATILRAYFGAEIIQVDGAVSALRWVEEVRFALIVTDIEKPGADGCDLIRALRSNPRTQIVPIIAVSSGDREAEARAAGTDAFLAKPFTLQNLVAEARRLASGV